jgi:Flp pilus assembly pilin Flp
MGQTLVEYGLILMFVSITALGLSPLGQWLAARLTNLAIAI